MFEFVLLTIDRAVSEVMRRIELQAVCIVGSVCSV